MERISWKPWTAISRKTQLAGTPDKIVTYRKGLKWLRPELIGQRVELLDESNDSIFATAEVISVKTCKFGDIDAIDHARQSGDMTPEQRLSIMRSCYGEYDNETITTVVTLGRIETL